MDNSPLTLSKTSVKIGYNKKVQVQAPKGENISVTSSNPGVATVKHNKY